MCVSFLSPSFIVSPSPLLRSRSPHRNIFNFGCSLRKVTFACCWYTMSQMLLCYSSAVYHLSKSSGVCIIYFYMLYLDHLNQLLPPNMTSIGEFTALLHMWVNKLFLSLTSIEEVYEMKGSCPRITYGACLCSKVTWRRIDRVAWGGICLWHSNIPLYGSSEHAHTCHKFRWSSFLLSPSSSKWKFQYFFLFYYSYLSTAFGWFRLNHQSPARHKIMSSLILHLGGVQQSYTQIDIMPITGHYY